MPVSTTETSNIQVFSDALSYSIVSYPKYSTSWLTHLNPPASVQSKLYSETQGNGSIEYFLSYLKLS